MNPYLTNVLHVGPRLLAREFKRIDRRDWDSPTGAGRFTPREVVAHLADWEPIFGARMRQAVASPNSVVEVYDEGDRARDHAYSEQDPDSCLAALTRYRDETVAWLKGLEPAQFKLAVVHPERGTMTVEDMANMLMGHDFYHLDQLAHVADR